MNRAPNERLAPLASLPRLAPERRAGAGRFAALVLLLPRQVQIVDHLVRLRCASSHPCRISTAAAWSTTARRRPPRTPRSDSLRVATAVDILSSVRADRHRRDRPRQRSA